jgi:hypothetical protein
VSWIILGRRTLFGLISGDADDDDDEGDFQLRIFDQIMPITFSRVCSEEAPYLYLCTKVVAVESAASQVSALYRYSSL